MVLATGVAEQGDHACRETPIRIDKKETINMAFLKHATAVAVLASAGVMGMAGMASASASNAWDNGGAEHHETGDNGVGQGGVIPINALNNVNVSPNLGCLVSNPLEDFNLNDVISLVEIPLNFNHLLENGVNILANGNVNTNTYDYSCSSNQGSSQAGNNSHGSVGAGDSYSSHNTADGAGSQNAGAGAGAGGLLGATGVLGRGGLDLG
jgi:hypothetical protein